MLFHPLPLPHLTPIYLFIVLTALYTYNKPAATQTATAAPIPAPFDNAPPVLLAGSPDLVDEPECIEEEPECVEEAEEPERDALPEMEDTPEDALAKLVGRLERVTLAERQMLETAGAMPGLVSILPEWERSSW
jgi:hypothetical protein